MAINSTWVNAEFAMPFFFFCSRAVTLNKDAENDYETGVEGWRRRLAMSALDSQDIDECIIPNRSG